jgi:ribose-phosphate pyrophosphokinase
MVYINGTPVNLIHYPDNTVKIDIPEEFVRNSIFLTQLNSNPVIKWRYESDSEFMVVAFLKKFFDDHSYNGMHTKVSLVMDYIPNARMDRVKSDTELFTLKYFASLINELHFDEVEVFDPHSTVSEALFNNLKIKRNLVTTIIFNVIEDVKRLYVENADDLVIFYPDEGSQKRYHNGPIKDCGLIAFFGSKIRDWKTGEIRGLSIETHTDKGLDYLQGKTVLIIDDIISAGGTVYYSIKELEKYGVKNVCCYASHLENTMFTQEQNKLRDMLFDGNSIFKKLYATDSLYNKGEQKNLEIIEL